jgi:hypothetical protein
MHAIRAVPTTKARLATHSRKPEREGHQEERRSGGGIRTRDLRVNEIPGRASAARSNSGCAALLGPYLVPDPHLPPPGVSEQSDYQAFLLVEPTGIEPVTSCLQIGRISWRLVAIGRQWPNLQGCRAVAVPVGGSCFPFVLGPYLIPNTAS